MGLHRLVFALLTTLSLVAVAASSWRALGQRDVQPEPRLDLVGEWVLDAFEDTRSSGSPSMSEALAYQVGRNRVAIRADGSADPVRGWELHNLAAFAAAHAIFGRNPVQEARDALARAAGTLVGPRFDTEWLQAVPSMRWAFVGGTFDLRLRGQRISRLVPTSLHTLREQFGSGGPEGVVLHWRRAQPPRVP